MILYDAQVGSFKPPEGVAAVPVPATEIALSRGGGRTGRQHRDVRRPDGVGEPGPSLGGLRRGF